MKNSLHPTPTRQDIADAYGIDRKTLYNWCKAADIKLSRGRIKPNEVTLIFEKFGHPQQNHPLKASGK